ncbi:MAG TPA: HAD-IB family phosphatase [Candidatus Acidoferrales bacterium]|nr:HAD-IB family phosphatase [Candidatus Acidoferrales bacterium]
MTIHGPGYNRDARVVAFCDFNGTIVDRDILDYLASMTRGYSENAPLPLEREYRGDIARRARALSFDRDEAERRLEAGIRFDDSFPDFSRACADAGVALVVLTSGIQELVERYLARRGVNLPVVGNSAEFRSDGWRIHFRDDSLAGIDKKSFVESARREGRLTVVLGDDRSDFEAALHADVVYAKTGSELQRYLASQQRRFHAFGRFEEILERWPPSTW